MDKKTPDTSLEDLSGLRGQIDDIDDKIIALLRQRTAIVGQIGESKHKNKPGGCPLRSGREAGMVRRIVKQFEGSPFPPAAAAAMWRILIGASLSIESPLSISVYAAEREDTLYWLAREYFGTFNPVIKQPHIKRVIGDLIDGKANIGIVPMLRAGDSSYWWTSLMQTEGNMPKIFAHVPFVYGETPGHTSPAGLAIGRIAAEPTGNDTSILVFEADHNVSQHRLQTAFTAAKMEATWIDIATLTPDRRHHLLSIKGYIDSTHEGLKKILAELGSSIINVAYLGAYANPVILSHTDSGKDKPHAKTAHSQ